MFSLRLLRLGAALLLALGFPLLKALSEPATPMASTNAAPAAPSRATKPARIPPKQLTGAELYSMHCNRCHPERYPTERTAAQWKTILMHMRVRANLPAEHARTILKYLQENSGR
jgi:cytochrome c5